MEAAIEAEKKVRVGRLAGVYVQGGELFDDVTSDGEGIVALQCRDGSARRQPDAMATETTEAYPMTTDASSSLSLPARHGSDYASEEDLDDM
uniref:Uncharacterized protein n=1 Tax=Oryza punctata TaxID=4537 RepID=A0A0E0LLJ0_ORYPU